MGSMTTLQGVHGPPKRSPWFFIGLLPSPSHYTQPVLMDELNQVSHGHILRSTTSTPPGCLFWCNANTWKRFTHTGDMTPPSDTQAAGWRLHGVVMSPVLCGEPPTPSL